MTTWIRTAIGAAGWLAFVAWRVPDVSDGAWAQALLLFAALVLVPLALDLFPDDDDPAVATRGFRWAGHAQLPAAAALWVSCVLPAGPLAALAAFPWAALTLLLAVLGFIRLRHSAWKREFHGICADVALVFVAIGGVWTMADRSGYSPLGFDPAIVSLTAVHFHYAGFLLPLFAGLVQRELFFWRSASRAAVGVILGVPAVAAGITMTQIGWGPSFEKAAACGLALAGMAVGVLQVRLAIDGRETALTRLLMFVSGVALFFGMVFAALYALRTTLAVAPWLGIPQMRMLHGTINAGGFALCGVLAWRRLAEERKGVEEAAK